jgi:GTP pyrophosphokinase
VAWDKQARSTRPVKIAVICKNEKGLLAEMTNAMKSADVNITSADIKTNHQENRAVCTFEVEVNDLEHLKNVMNLLRKIKKVVSVQRLTNTVKEIEHEPTL